jgi:hypothetical protein
MWQLSVCIFEWDAADVRRMLEAKRSELEAKRSELEGKHGMVVLTEAEVSRKIIRKEIALHCRSRTRWAATSEILICPSRDLQQRKGGRHPGHPVAGLHPHPGNLERAEASPPLYTGLTRSANAGLSLSTGLHILGSHSNSTGNCHCVVS